MTRSVLVFVLAGSNWIRRELAVSLLAIAADDRFAVEIQMHDLHPVSSARNAARREALRGGFDYLVMIDDDNPPPPNVLDLCALGLDVVGAPTPVWYAKQFGDRPWYWNALVDAPDAEGWRPVQDVTPEPCNRGELVEVDVIGGGCMVVARRVLEAVPAPFMETFDDDGVLHSSEDYQACERWRAAGFRVWAHFGYRCQHFKEVDLLKAFVFSAEAVTRAAAAGQCDRLEELRRQVP